MGNPWWKETQPRASEVEEFSSPPENKRNDFIVALRGSKETRNSEDPLIFSEWKFSPVSKLFYYLKKKELQGSVY